MKMLLLVLPARHHLPLSGRGTRPAAGRRAVRAAAGSRSDRQLAADAVAATARARRCRGVRVRPISAFPAARHGFRRARAIARLAVDRQEMDPRLVACFTRKSLELRREHRSLRLGSMRIIEAGEQTLAFERSDRGELLRCTFNLSDRPVSFTPSGEEADRKRARRRYVARILRRNHRGIVMSMRPMIAGFVLAGAFASTAPAQSVQHLANGIEASNGSTRMQVTALTDSIVRVRVSRSGSLPEDASWAVPCRSPSRRALPVTATPDGFKTGDRSRFTSIPRRFSCQSPTSRAR